MRNFFTFLILISAFFISNAQVAQQWATRYNNWSQSGTDYGKSIVVDDSGFVYVAGISEGTGGFSDYMTIKYDANGNSLWEQRFTGAGNFHDYLNAMVIDDSSNVYITGTSFGGGGWPTNNYLTIKYDKYGNQQWLAVYDGPDANYDEPFDIAASDSGNVYVTGYSVSNANGEDYLTVKYDKFGNQLWASRYDAGFSLTDKSTDIAIDDSGNVYITGWSDGNTTNEDYATIKYNAAGQLKWIKRYNYASGTDIADAIALDSSGNVYVTGASFSTVTDNDATTLKYDRNGNQIWVKRYNYSPLNAGEAALDIAVDKNKNIYITGLGTNGIGNDYLTIKYDSNGTQKWVATYNGPANNSDVARALAVDTLGNVYVTGIRVSLTGSQDYATICYDSLGNQVWLMSYNGTGNLSDYGFAITVDKFGSVYVTGQSNGGGTSYDFATIKYIPIPVAVQEQYYYSGMSISPNPSTGIFNAQCPMPDDGHLEITNILGEKVFSSPIANNSITVNLSEAAKGIYFLKIQSGTNIYTDKLIIQ